MKKVQILDYVIDQVFLDWKSYTQVIGFKFCWPFKFSDLLAVQTNKMKLTNGQWTNGQMDKRTIGQMDRRTNGQLDKWIVGQIDKWTIKKMDSWSNRQMDKWTIGQMDNWTDG